MEIAIAVISLIAYIMSLFCFRKKPITQQLTFLYIYLTGLTITSHMTVLLPIYFLFSFFPFIKGISKISKTIFFLFFYVSIYLIIGLFVQDFFATATAFIAKLWQLLIFFFILDSSQYINNDISIKQLIIAILVESALGIYLMLNSTNVDFNGMVRLVSGAQPITGNIAIVILPLFVYLFFKYNQSRQKKMMLFFIYVLFFIWSILSGTRGYTLLYTLVLAGLLYDYFPKRYNTQIIVGRTSMIFFITLIVGVMGLIIFDPLILEKFARILRIESSVGIRTFENAAEIEFFINGPLYTELFGIGLGGIAGDYPEFSQAILRQGSLGMWNLEHYLMDAGALYHNLYANILLNLGIIGIIFAIIANVEIWNRISNICKNLKLLKRTFHFYQIGFIWMNYYRWSGDCGISEMIILAMVLKIIKEEIQPKSINNYRKKLGNE